jgi:hypothetical protein
MIRILPVLMMLACLSGCAYSIHEVHVGGYEPFTPQSAGQVVSAHSEQFVFLGFTGSIDYVDQAYDDLQQKCPKGDIVGIVTEYQTALGFLSWKNHIYLKGLCTGEKSSKRSSRDEDKDLST